MRRFMGSFKCLENIGAWQKARLLFRETYEISSQDSFSRDFVLRDQIRKAALSIMGNIAEGFERGGSKEFFQFLAIAKGSGGEVISHLYAALDQNHISQKTFDDLYIDTKNIMRMIAGLMAYLKKTNIKGLKYR